MADLRPYQHRDHFHRGLRMLKSAYDISADAIDLEIDEAGEAQQEHRRLVEVEGDEIEYNDGFVVVTGAMMRQMRLDACYDAAAELRAAFIVAFFHHWERSVCRWVGKHLNNFDAQIKAVEALGYPLHAELEAVRCLANLIKHDNDKWGERVRNCWPDMFPQSVKLWPANTGWYEIISLTDIHVRNVHRIVKASGPQEFAE